MSVGSIASLPPVSATHQAQVPVAQKPVTQAVAQPISGGDSDGDNDGSGGSVNITPPVNIKA